MAKSKKTGELALNQLRQVAYETDLKVQEYHKMAEAGLFAMVVMLVKIKDEKLYKYMGDDGQNTWDAYLSGRHLVRRTVDPYMDAYKLYVEEMEKPPELVASVGMGKLTKFKGAIKKAEPEERGELFEKLCVLSMSDCYTEFEEKKLIKKRPIRITRCLDCRKTKVSYDQDMVCMCRGLGITAMPIVE